MESSYLNSYNFSFNSKKKNFIIYSNNLKEKTENVNFIDASKLDSIMKHSTKSYSLVYIYAYWCGPCRIETPKIIELAKNNPQVEIIFVNTDRTKDYEMTKNYLTSINFPYTSFTASEEYGKGRRRLGNFIEAICPTCQNDKMGYSSSILYNKEGKVIFSSTYEMTNMVEQIQNHVSQ
jgi:thiol-disulfide isomerase/thioredoxin